MTASTPPSARKQGLIDIIIEANLPPAMAKQIGLQALVDGIAEIELGVLDAAAAHGFVSPEAAARARSAAATLDLDASALAGPMMAQGREVKAVVDQLASVLDAEASAVLHAGLTTQDVVDTANSMRWTRLAAMLEAELAALCRAMADRAEAEAATPMLGRTSAQPAAPLTFGYRLARHLDVWLRLRAELQNAAAGAATAQLGGAVGLAAPWGDRTDDVWADLARRFGLTMPPISWHTGRDRLSALGFQLQAITGALARFGEDVVLGGLTGEITEGQLDDGFGGSSAMPHKRNPQRAETLEAIGALAAADFQKLQFGCAQKYDRSAVRGLAETAAMDSLFACAGAAVRLAQELLGVLHFDAAMARANLDATHGLALSEMVVEDLAGTSGYAQARAHVSDAVKQRKPDETLHAALSRLLAEAGLPTPSTGDELLARAVKRAEAKTLSIVSRARESA